jgi:hypothetical protein
LVDRLEWTVYAVGLYVDGAAVKSKLSKYKGQSAEVLCVKKEFFRGVSTDQFHWWH